MLRFSHLRETFRSIDTTWASSLQSEFKCYKAMAPLSKPEGLKPYGPNPAILAHESPNGLINRAYKNLRSFNVFKLFFFF